MRGAFVLIVALCAVGALADEPKKKNKNEKKPKKQQKQKDCPACPADLSDELAAATKRAEAAEAKTCPEGRGPAAVEARAGPRRSRSRSGTRSSARRWTRSSSQEGRQALEGPGRWVGRGPPINEGGPGPSHAEPVVPGVSTPMMVLCPQRHGWLDRGPERRRGRPRVAGEAAKTGYQALVDAIPTDGAAREDGMRCTAPWTRARPRRRKPW